MSKFKIIYKNNNIPNKYASPKWQDAINLKKGRCFDSKGRYINVYVETKTYVDGMGGLIKINKYVDDLGNKIDNYEKGPIYELKFKKVRQLSHLERATRGFLGIVAVVCSLGLAFFSKNIRKLFTKRTESIRFGVRISNTVLNHSNLNNTTNISQEDKAAILIQNCFRGYLTRKSFLPRELYARYLKECVTALGPDSNTIPQAADGDTRVYLPQTMSEIILKHLENRPAIKRFQQMQQVRSVLHAQKSLHLVIPKVRLCGDFLVEQRLPINTDSYHNMELYSSQPQLFDQAICELTRLFSKKYIGDLVNSCQSSPLREIVGDVVRYDNLPLYIIEKDGEKEGKIGLIDLERIQDVEDSSSRELNTLVRIFPLHLDLIKKEAATLKMQLDQKSLDSLAASAEEGKKYLQVSFLDHLQWLKDKGISTNNALQIFKINPQREQELISLLKEELLKLNRGENDLHKRNRYIGTPGKFFFTDEEKMAEELEELASEAYPLIIEQILEKTQKEKLKELSKPMSESQLVSLRSPSIGAFDFRKSVQELIANHEKINFKNNDCLFYEACDVADQLIYAIMQELVKGGELFSFALGYYPGKLWIRY